MRQTTKLPLRVPCCIGWPIAIAILAVALTGTTAEAQGGRGGYTAGAQSPSSSTLPFSSIYRRLHRRGAVAVE